MMELDPVRCGIWGSRLLGRLFGTSRTYSRAPVSCGSCTLCLWLLYRRPHPRRRIFLQHCHNNIFQEGLALFTPPPLLFIFHNNINQSFNAFYGFHSNPRSLSILFANNSSVIWSNAWVVQHLFESQSYLIRVSCRKNCFPILCNSSAFRLVCTLLLDIVWPGAVIVCAHNGVRSQLPSFI